MRTIESLKVTRSACWQTPITSLQEVKGFFRLLWKDLQLNFHPDDSFDLYIDTATGNRVFDNEAATILNTRMDECFEVCEKADVDIYEIGMDEQYGFLGLSSES